MYFDELYLDEKGYVSGEGVIVVGAFFNKEARNSTYAKASLGTFPSLPIPEVFNLRVCLMLCGISIGELINN